MKSKLAFVAFIFMLMSALPSLAQENKLGTVRFPTSCDPEVQPAS